MGRVFFNRLKFNLADRFTNRNARKRAAAP
jgi:hypothetical protein